MDSDIVGKLTLLSDSLMKNGEMWLTLIAFIVVVLAVNLIRTRMFDYAWRIAIVAGGVIYIVIMLAGSMSLGISISVFSLIIYTVVAVMVESYWSSLCLVETIQERNVWNMKMTITIIM